MSKKNHAQLVFELAAKFVSKHEGAWDHAQWEKIVKDAGEAGLDTDAESLRHLGNILEAGKYFFHRSSVKPKPEKKAKEKGKEKDKPKEKEKAKDKPKDKDKPKKTKPAAVPLPKPAKISIVPPAAPGDKKH